MPAIARRSVKIAALGLSLLAVSSVSRAADWLMLQGTEPASASARAEVWGFVQAEFQYIGDIKLPSGSPAAFNRVGPDLSSSTSFNIRRAQLGVRGTGFNLDSNANYFLAAEWGNNVTTKFGSPQLTDASISLNYIPYARLRVGQFKTPGSEEGLQPVASMSYINFTNAADSLLLERALVTAVNCNGDSCESTADANGAFGAAFRDIGMQVFDTVKFADWEHSYAFMLADGNGIGRSDNNGAKDYYLYWASERVFSGQGASRQGWKTFGWYEGGRRLLSGDNFNRSRMGLGSKFLNGSYRVSGEFVRANGVIFAGTKGATITDIYTVLLNDSAYGWYLDVGYSILPKLGLNVRWDQLSRGTEINERDYRTITLGAEYAFNKKTTAIVNYELRSGAAPNNANADKILGSLANRFGVQVTAIF